MRVYVVRRRAKFRSIRRWPTSTVQPSRLNVGKQWSSSRYRMRTALPKPVLPVWEILIIQKRNQSEGM